MPCRMLAVALVVGVAVIMAHDPPRAVARSIDASIGCGSAVARVGPGGTRGATTPVLLVHGFAGRPTDFRRTLNGYPNLLDTVRALPGAPISARPRRSFCDLIGATDTQAVRAMPRGSPKLRALPDWNPRVRIVAMAGDVVFSVGAFGASQDIGIGDVAVGVDSATAGASPGTRPFVARCRESLTDAVAVIDASACAHANEVANRRIVEQVGDRVRDALRRSVRWAR